MPNHLVALCRALLHPELGVQPAGRHAWNFFGGWKKILTRIWKVLWSKKKLKWKKKKLWKRIFEKKKKQTKKSQMSCSKLQELPRNHIVCVRWRVQTMVQTHTAVWYHQSLLVALLLLYFIFANVFFSKFIRVMMRKGEKKVAREVAIKVIENVTLQLNTNSTLVSLLCWRTFQIDETEQQTWNKMH